MRLEGKKRIGMSCFLLVLQRLDSLKYNFNVFKKEMESYIRKGGEGFKKSYVLLHGERGGVKNCQNRPYVINELLLSPYPALELDSMDHLL